MKNGQPRRRRSSVTRKPGAMRDAARNPPLGHLEPAALVAHRELAYLRNPTAERLRKLQEAQAQLDAGGGGSDAA